MAGCFSTCVLRSDDSGKIRFEKWSKSVKPRTPFGVDEKDILLAGGFAETFPDSSIPLSPALQLNLDRTALSSEQLHRFAEAELRRLQDEKVRRYQLDVDLRVCVIADSSSLLDDFCDIYGGVLEIETLQVGGGRASLAGRDVSIADTGAEYQISYRKPAPIDLSLCSYCGACGRGCPEGCISPELEIDMARCLLCRQCESSCPEEAIDIHAVEELSLQVPAIIVLGDPKIDLPARETGIFGAREIAKFFSTLFSSEIEEVVSHTAAACQYSGRLDLGCSLCVDNCPHGALEKTENGIRLDHLLCADCGNCVSVCPTGAMQNGRLTDPDFVRYIRNVDLPDSATLVVGEEDALRDVWWYSRNEERYNSVFLQYPNPQCLSCYHLLCLFCAGAARIVLLGQPGKRLQCEIDKANHLTTTLFGCSCVETVKTDQVDDVLSLAQREVAHPLSRSSRAFFQGLEDVNRRAGFVAILESLVAVSPIEAKGDTELVIDPAESGLEFLEMSCAEDGCTHCYACINECKMRALRTDEDEQELQYVPGLCVGCGLCVGVCPENVLSLQHATSLNASYFNQRRLAFSEPARCKGCGKVFGARKSLDRVMAILADKERFDREHFEYCGECRVIRLFEAEEI